MKQRVFIVHGWGASPEQEWFPWLVRELAPQGIEVIVPVMPNTMSPQIDAWVAYLVKIVGVLRDTDIFVGHSIGCQAILRYLAMEHETSIRGLICVAGWFTLKNLENDEEVRIARPWLETPIDFDAVKRIAGPIIAIFSDTDPYVELAENRELFEQRLGAHIIVEHNKGHFSEDNNIYELPVVRDCIFELLKT